MIRWKSYERVRALVHVAVWIVMRRINWIIAGSTSAPENLFIRCPALISPQPKSGIGLSFRLELDLLHSYSYRILLVSGCRLRRCLPHAAPGFADRSLDFSSRTIERLI